MSFAQYDVVVVGAGCAGLTAAVGLARAGFAVAVVEAAPHPGAENWSGCVYFTENLAHPDVLGPEGVEVLAWERRLVERGSFATDGRSLVGCTYRDPDAFEHCYTVLRPIYDHHLAQMALSHGAALLTGTTVESLIRDGRRVIGVATRRGLLYANLVFLAEGDAAHLVAREGYQRSADPRDAPRFLYGIKQVIDLPPGAVEERLGVGPEQGVAYDLLLRNVRRGGRRLLLNARGFLYTNRQGLSVGLVLPAEHLARHFGGDPGQLLEWFEDAPALRPWWREGRRGVLGVKLLRGGGARDIPYLIEDGLAVGGAAAGLGVDYPVLNFTGPATATGLLLSRAAAAIRAEGGDFRRDQLDRHYLEPLRRTRYWKDVEFLHRWPGYLRKTHVLFDHALDLALDSAAVWAGPRRSLPGKLLSWCGLLSRVGWPQWRDLRDDLRHLGKALRFREVAVRPALGRLLLDGALNTFGDLLRRPRPHLPPGGLLRLHYRADGGDEGAVPFLVRRWFARLRPVLASAAHLLHRNDDTPLSGKLAGVIRLLTRQVNLLDVLAAGALALATTLTTACLAVLGRLLRRRRPAPPRGSDAPELAAPGPPQDLPVPYHTGAASHVHVLWKAAQPGQRAAAVGTLTHVCPASVFEAGGGPPGAPHVAVHYARCIKCEACWRTSPIVDWGRDGQQRLVYPVRSPVVTRLLRAQDDAGLVRPPTPRRADPWGWTADRQHAGGALSPLLDRLEHKLAEFEAALAKGPDTVDRARTDHLEMLARYAQQLASQVLETLRQDGAPGEAEPLALALVARTEERTRRTWDGRLAWAAADGRQVRQHHLTGLRRLLGVEPAPHRRAVVTPPSSGGPVAAGEQSAEGLRLLAEVAARRYLVETLAHALVPGGGATAAQSDLLRAVAACSPVAEVGNTYRRHGPRLLEGDEETRALLAVEGDWPTLVQRRALQAELEETQRAEARLAGLARDWRTAPRPPAAHAEVAEGFARQAAHLLASKCLLLCTHARLEEGLDAELDMALLRVWLDGAAALLDEFAGRVQARLHPPARHDERPLVEPGSGPPPTSLDDYLAGPDPYAAGDFLAAPVDLLRPRLVPEMIAGEVDLVRLAPAGVLSGGGKTGADDVTDGTVSALSAGVARIRDRLARSQTVPSADWVAWRLESMEEALCIAEALAVETVGHRLHRQARPGALESAGACLVVADLGRRVGEMAAEIIGQAEVDPPAPLHEVAVFLQRLTEDGVPRFLDAGTGTGPRHVGRDALELEARKADVRQRLVAAWREFGAALLQNPNVQASCFALAEAAAWLQAADGTLGRMAWLSRLSQAEDRDEPEQEVGRRALARCHAEARDRLHRFDEDLSALRRGYHAPHVRAAALLRVPAPGAEDPPPIGHIEEPLRVLVVLEPSPAVLPGSAGGRVLETFWTLGAADRAALEAALRLRDAAPDLVAVEAAALGPRRVGQALREVLSLGADRVRLVVQDHEAITPERAAAALVAAPATNGAFDLVLGGEAHHREKRLAALVADLLGVHVAGRAGQVAVDASEPQRQVRLVDAGARARQRPLPAAVFVAAGMELRPFTVAGYLAGLGRGIELVEV